MNILTRCVLLIMVLVCGVVSAYDNTLNIITIDCLEDIEQNPIALFIIKLSGVPSLIYVKALSTLLAVVIMVRLVYTKWWPAIPPVFIFQLWLFSYLTFYTTEEFYRSDALSVAKSVLEFFGDIYLT